MGERENLIELVDNYLERAESKLRSAAVLLKEGLYDDSISRSYYATFLATKGVLLLMGEQPKSHTGLLTLFGLKIVKKGLMEKKYAKILTSLFDARQNGDYQALVWFDEKDAEEYLNSAKEFVNEIKKLMKNLMEE
ncbi:MAG: HEPN domain-containing protein [Candidatus Hodarchaeales archaeon]